MDNGSVYPAEVLEGSIVTVICNQGFEIEGSKILECKNEKLQDSSGSGLPTCVPINQGLTHDEGGGFATSNAEMLLSLISFLTPIKNVG